MFTLELWFKRTGAGVGQSTGTGGIASAIPLITKGRAEAETPANLNMNYFFGIDASTGKLVADFEDTAGRAPTTRSPARPSSPATSGITPPRPTDGTTWRLLPRRRARPAPSPRSARSTPEATSIQHAGVGTALNSSRRRRRLLPGRRRRGPDLERRPQPGRDPGQQEHRDRRPGRPASGAGTSTRAAARPPPPASGQRQQRHAAAGRRPAGLDDGFVATSHQPPPSAPVLDGARQRRDRRSSPRRPSTSWPPTPTTPTADVTFFGRPLASGVFAQIGSATGRRLRRTRDHRLDRSRRRADATSGSPPSATARRPRPARPGRSTPPPAPIRCSSAPATSRDCDGHRRRRPPPRSWPASTGRSSRPATTSTRTARLTEFTNCYDPIWGPFKARTRPVPGNHDWNTGNLNGYFALLRRERHRRQRPELLQLRHRPVLARRRPRLRLRHGARRLRRRFGAGGLAEGRPGRQLDEERHRDLAQAALQLGLDQPHRDAAARRRPVRGGRRHRPRRPRPHLRALPAARPDRRATTRRSASGTSRSGPAARRTTPRERRSRRARPSTKHVRHLRSSRCTRRATTGSSCRSPARRSPIAAPRPSTAHQTGRQSPSTTATRRRRTRLSSWPPQVSLPTTSIPTR